MKIASKMPTHLRTRILYHIAKSAWEGTLRDDIEQLPERLTAEIEQDFGKTLTPEVMANHIRIALGLNPIKDAVAVTIEDVEQALVVEQVQHPVIVANEQACGRCGGDRNCLKMCHCNAIIHAPEGGVSIDYENCLYTGACVDTCELGALSDKAQFVPLLHLLKQTNKPVFASVAPAFAGQFGDDVTAGKLRSALMHLGFTDMVETALYADLITMKEALEFDHLVKSEDDFMITSCCCPVWIKIIQNKFPHLVENISPSVSPMIASGRVIKAINPDAKVVFIGPCIAKKAEALEPEVKGAIDFVLTFKELATVFDAVGIDPATMPDEEHAQASWGGRIYGRTGGVSTAIASTLETIMPDKAVKVKAVQVDGVPACQKLLGNVKEERGAANFIEGMGCLGGCVGGPGRIVSIEVGTDHVNQYGDASHAKTPVENANVYLLLDKVGQTQGSDLSSEGPMAALLKRNFIVETKK